MLLPFYFRRVSENRYLVSNLLRKFQFVDKIQFEKLCAGEFDEELKNFFAEEEEIDLIAEAYRKNNAGLFFGTTLHIFVLTLACNLNCLYCQAEYERGGNPFMSEEVTRRAVDFALSSPEKELYFEFQGGEPLLNFGTLKTIVEYANERCGEKVIQFSLVTNAQAMTEEILKYLAAHDVRITFSIDGPKFIHDANRPTKDGSSNFDKVFLLVEASTRRLFRKKFCSCLADDDTSFIVARKRNCGLLLQARRGRYFFAGAVAFRARRKKFRNDCLHAARIFEILNCLQPERQHLHLRRRTHDGQSRR